MISMLSSALTEVVEHIEQCYGKKSFSDTGSFDEIYAKAFGGSENSVVSVIGNNQGDTSCLAINIALQASLVDKKTVAVFQVGQTKSLLASKMLSAVGGLNIEDLLSGILFSDDWSKLTFALGVLNDADVYIDDIECCAPINLAGRVESFCEKHGDAGLIIVDLSYANTENCHMVAEELDLLKFMTLIEIRKIPVVFVCTDSVLEALGSADFSSKSNVVMFVSRAEMRGTTRVGVEINFEDRLKGIKDRLGLVLDEDYQRFKEFNVGVN